jgi:hypothetical protein
VFFGMFKTFRLAGSKGLSLPRIRQSPPKDGSVRSPVAETDQPQAEAGVQAKSPDSRPRIAVGTGFRE